jgi:penicillin-binding protein 1B
MTEQGLISRSEAKTAAQQPLGVEQGELRSSGSPAFMDLVKRQLRRDYKEEDLSVSGLRIFSTMDPWFQQQAEASLSQQLAELESRPDLEAGILQGALTLADSETGEVLAVVGDRNPRYAGFNRALDAVRPVGSLIKPAVFLTALSKPGDYHLLTPVEDTPIQIKGSNDETWTPSNYDNQSHQGVILEQALSKSYNLATIHLGLSVGIESVMDNLYQLGIRRPLKPYPSLFLGAVSLSPMEMTQMYQTLANGGYGATLKAIRDVTDAKGTPLSRYPLAIESRVDSKAVYLLRHALNEVTRSGTGRALRWLLPEEVQVAGKTGTTDNLRDSWFAGFDKKHIAVAWVGRDDNRPTGLTGSSGAMRVWARLMNAIGVSTLEQNRPVGVEMIPIDPETGLLGEGCPQVVEYPFITGSEPVSRATCAESDSLVEDGVLWFHRLFN